MPTPQHHQQRHSSPSLSVSTSPPPPPPPPPSYSSGGDGDDEVAALVRWCSSFGCVLPAAAASSSMSLKQQQLLTSECVARMKVGDRARRLLLLLLRHVRPAPQAAKIKANLALHSQTAVRASSSSSSSASSSSFSVPSSLSAARTAVLEEMEHASKQRTALLEQEALTTSHALTIEHARKSAQERLDELRRLKHELGIRLQRLKGEHIDGEETEDSIAGVKPEGHVMEINSEQASQMYPTHHERVEHLFDDIRERLVQDQSQRQRESRSSSEQTQSRCVGLSNNQVKELLLQQCDGKTSSVIESVCALSSAHTSQLKRHITSLSQEAPFSSEAPSSSSPQALSLVELLWQQRSAHLKRWEDALAARNARVEVLSMCPSPASSRVSERTRLLCSLAASQAALDALAKFADELEQRVSVSKSAASSASATLQQVKNLQRQQTYLQTCLTSTISGSRSCRRQLSRLHREYVERAHVAISAAISPLPTMNASNEAQFVSFLFSFESSSSTESSLREALGPLGIRQWTDLQRAAMNSIVKLLEEQIAERLAVLCRNATLRAHDRSRDHGDVSLEKLTEKVQHLSDQLVEVQWKPAVNHAIDRAQHALKVEIGRTKEVLDDWWSLPAQHLLPSVQRRGLNVNEWKSRFRKLSTPQW